MSKVLVAGSYPPVPGRAASASFAEVGRHVARSDDVTVLSPRPSAAHRHGPMTGIGAAATLWLHRRFTGANCLVLCLEMGVPIHVGAGRLRTRLETMALSLSLRRFDRVTLLLGADVREMSAVLFALWRRPYEVVVASEEEREFARTALGISETHLRVEEVPSHSKGEMLLTAEAVDARGSVSALGPRELEEGDRVRTLAARAERAVYRAEHSGARLAHIALGDKAHLVGRPLRFAVEPFRTRVRHRALKRPEQSSPPAEQAR